MASVGDCEVPLKAGKSSKLNQSGKLILAAGCSGPPPFPSPLILFCSSLSYIALSEVLLWVIYSIFFLLGCISRTPCTAIAMVVWDSQNICHRSRGAKTLDSTLSPGSGIHTIWLFPSQLLNRWLAWFLSAAALLTLRAKIRRQHGRMYAASLFRWSKQHAGYKEWCDKDPLPKSLTWCSLPQFTVQI